MEMFKNFAKAVIIAICIFAAIGSTGYLFYIGKPQFAIANIVLAAVAAPTCVKFFKETMQ